MFWVNSCKTIWYNLTQLSVNTFIRETYLSPLTSTRFTTLGQCEHCPSDDQQLKCTCISLTNRNVEKVIIFSWFGFFQRCDLHIGDFLWRYNYANRTSSNMPLFLDNKLELRSCLQWILLDICYPRHISPPLWQCYHLVINFVRKKMMTQSFMRWPLCNPYNGYDQLAFCIKIPCFSYNSLILNVTGALTVTQWWSSTLNPCGIILT